MSPLRKGGAIAISEQLRLEECAREPIRTPGAIQAHGVLVGFDETGTVVLASENCAAALGVDAADLLGAPMPSVLPPSVLATIADIVDPDSVAANPLAVVLGDRAWDLIAHRTGSVTIVEFEPALDDPVAVPSVVFDAIHRMTEATTVEGIRARAVREVCRLTGFDRVMVYHFHPDGHGEVVAEECAEGMEPYVGLHFPASDIPLQARHLYLTKLSRSIVSTERPVSPLLSTDESGALIDLGLAQLRSVSPYHLQFMRNMGQASTVSFSLVRDGQLIGMITCAHRTERRLPYLVRSGLEVLASQLALQVRSMEEIERLTEASRVRELRAQLVRAFFESADLASGLLDGPTTVLDVIPADGVLCSIAGVHRSLGFAPPLGPFEVALTSLRGDAIATDSVQTDFPELAAQLPGVAGLIVIPVGVTGDFIAFFRQEVIRTVDWLGDLSQDNRPDPLSPRLSFSSWSQSVKGTSLPWDHAAEDAVELGRDLDRALLRRAESQLAVVALRDPLTGLPNRRALLERLARQLDEAPHGSYAVLFLDLDHFKAVNDSLGHDIGDLLLIEIADRLAGAARAQDTVARLGGDEFVVVCANATAEQADAVATRILETVREPLELAGHPVQVTASVGIAFTGDGVTPAQLLKRADTSMYVAKAAGRDRAAR